MSPNIQSLFEMPDVTRSVRVAPPAPLDYSSMYGTMAKYGPTPNFSLGEPFGQDGANVAVRDAVGTPVSFFDRMGSRLRDSGFLGSTDTKTGLRTDGWGGMALGAASSLAQLYTGMKQYGLMKDQLAFSKDAFNKNYRVQAADYDRRIGEQYDRRAAEGLMPVTMPKAEYMAKYGVK